jgi:transportin-3
MAAAASAAGGFAPVLAALSTMQSNGPRDEKTKAHEYLEKFQKSVGSSPERT